MFKVPLCCMRENKLFIITIIIIYLPLTHEPNRNGCERDCGKKLSISNANVDTWFIMF